MGAALQFIVLRWSQEELGLDLSQGAYLQAVVALAVGLLSRAMRCPTPELLLAAQRVLANREQFVLDQRGLEEWEHINNRPARELPGLIRLLQRPTPFHLQG